MKINKFINLENGFIADICNDIDIPMKCYKILICVDIDILNYENDINFLPCYPVIVPIKELYYSMKKDRLIVKEFDYVE